MGQKIELGKTCGVGTGIVSAPTTVKEQVTLLEERVASLTRIFNTISSDLVKKTRHQDIHNVYTNKDGIPIDISLLGQSMRGGIHVLSVKQDKYYIGTSGYDSLSAAAEAASGIRRSGWVFWKTPDGRTVKEVYGKTNG